MSLTYRPEIDGLRAISVLAVVIYHAELQIGGRLLLPGGYLGVDVFFVISGYLITSIIRSEQMRGTFRLLHFWERRARRILPMLLLVILSTLVAGWYMMLPIALTELATEAVAALAFVSNVIFFVQDSYTAEASQLKPLLHSWSLAIEEQFYLLFPLLMIGAGWIRGPGIWLVLIPTFAASLIAAHLASLSAPEAAFFLLPYRAWELAAGAMLAMWCGPGALRRGLPLPPATAGFAALLLVGSFVLFDHQTRHPSAWTLIPVISTAVILGTQTRGGALDRLLSSYALTRIGLLSYGFYLWHFPVFSFLRIQLGDPPQIVMVAGALGAFALSAISYRLIEQPARRPERVALRPLLYSIAAGYLLIVASDHQIKANGGFPSRLPEHLQHMAKAEFGKFSMPGQPGRNIFGSETARCMSRTPETACQIGDGHTILLGDSFADVLSPALAEAARENAFGLRIMTAGICPFVADHFSFSQQGCRAQNTKRRAAIAALPEPRTFIVSADIIILNDSRLSPEAQTALRNGADIETSAVQSYRDAVTWLLDQGHRVIMVHNPPDPAEESNAYAMLKRRSLSVAEASAPITMAPGEYERTAARDQLTALPPHPNLIDIFPREILCPETLARRCIAADARGPVFNHGRHLSRPAVDRIVAAILPHLPRP